jgi:shikimate kinase
MLSARGVLLATGGGAVLDADNRRLLRELGFVVHLHVSVAQQLERLARDHTRPLLARDDREQVLHNMAAARAPLYAEVADLRFDTDHLTSAAATGMLVAILDQRWQRPGQAAVQLDAGNP